MKKLELIKKKKEEEKENEMMKHVDPELKNMLDNPDKAEDMLYTLLKGE